jgi:hypothetical protein
MLSRILHFGFQNKEKGKAKGQMALTYLEKSNKNSDFYRFCQALCRDDSIEMADCFMIYRFGL